MEACSAAAARPARELCRTAAEADLPLSQKPAWPRALLQAGLRRQRCAAMVSAAVRWVHPTDRPLPWLTAYSAASELCSTPWTQKQSLTCLCVLECRAGTGTGTVLTTAGKLATGAGMCSCMTTMVTVSAVMQGLREW